MTNSHPSKVKGEAEMVQITCLTSGIDTLRVSLDIIWKTPDFLSSLRAHMESAKQLAMELPFSMPEGDGQGEISFMMKPFGSQGYTWLLVGHDYSLKIMDWAMPKSRPSIVAELHSELLWRLGPLEAVQRLVAALEHLGAHILRAKPSRVDLCMDVLFPDVHWNINFSSCLVSASAKETTYREHRKVTGFTFGKKNLSCRIYDKAHEIAVQSGKTWFFDLWGIPEVPEGKKVIRIEFQLERTVLREMGFHDVMVMFQGLNHIWAYCTENWLKFQSNPGKHHTQRKTLPWWQAVQSSFLGICDGEPLIRAKAIETDQTRLRQQATGLCSSLLALDQESQFVSDATLIGPEDYPRAIEEALFFLGKAPAELRGDVARKLVKKARLRTKMLQAIEQRQRLGLVPQGQGGKP